MDQRILALLQEGKGYIQISMELGVGSSTISRVKNYRKKTPIEPTEQGPTGPMEGLIA
jgi:hypothetical protein